MASVIIEKRNKANGEPSYRCIVRVKKKSVIIPESRKHSVKKNLLQRGKNKQRDFNPNESESRYELSYKTVVNIT